MSAPQLSPMERALITAARLGAFEDVSSLLQSESLDVNCIDPGTGMTPLHYAAGYDAICVVEILVAQPAIERSIQHADHWGRRPADLARLIANNPKVAALLEAPPSARG